MNDDNAFLSAVIGNPDDRLLKLVYADWLEERGDPRHEYLRIKCRLEESLKHSEQQELLLRAEELRKQLPANWLAALDGPIWSVVANVVLERQYGPEAETRHGTKHFKPGAKVYVFDFYWGMGGEQVTVVGRHRKSNRYITLIMQSSHLANWRVELVYTPAIIQRITKVGGELGRNPRGEMSRTRAVEIVEMFNRRGATTQPFITRSNSEEQSD